MNAEDFYIFRRKLKAGLESAFFYLFRPFPIKKNKIVFCAIEGSMGYACNPKYIAEEIIRQKSGFELVWLVNDTTKIFPPEIKVVENTLIKRAFHLTTAKFWIDNSRKQLEARKRDGQIYIQTWHAKLGFKPTCLDRGASFSKIAYLVSKHDSDMIDYVLSNSDWYDKTLPNGMLYEGKILRSGSPRCDILVNDSEKMRKIIRKRYKLKDNAKIIMYAPTFRGGSQGTKRAIEKGDHAPNYERLQNALSDKFGGEWTIFLRLHPQLTARHIASDADKNAGNIIDVSEADDMYELLAACDAFMTDYSSAAFDAAVTRMPIFLYADDYAEYENERGKLLWDLRNLPFPLATNDNELSEQIKRFDNQKYLAKLNELFKNTGMAEDGKAAKRVVKFIVDMKN